MNCPRCGQVLPDASRFCNACGQAISGDAPQESSLPPPSNPGSPDEPTAAWTVNVGDVLDGKWRVEGILGKGGMGTVYLAHDLELERKVAVKVLATALCCDTGFVARFLREAKLTAQLEHPNVVPVYAVGRQRGRPFLVMKNLKGVTLHRYLRAKARQRKLLSQAEVLHVFRQLCSGIDFIHGAGFVHRDIKASNIFLSPDGLATILDFGILRDVRSSQGLTQTGTFLGTPHYMSPEQALGIKDIDHRADIYALGVLLFECIAGVFPFTGESDLAVIQKHAHTPPPDLTELVATVPKAAARVVQMALAKDRQARFQSGAQLFQALSAAWPADPRAPVEPTSGPIVIPTDFEVAERITPSRPGSPSGQGRPPTHPPPPPPPSLVLPAELVEEVVEEPERRSAPTVQMAQPGPLPEELPSPLLKPPSAWRRNALIAGLALPLLGAGAWFAARSPPEPVPLPKPVEAPHPPPEPSASKPIADPTPTPPVVEPAPPPEDPKPPPTEPAKVKQKKGRLQIVATKNGEPFWASVKVDGVDSGDTPVMLDLAPGKHQVVLERAGFKPINREVVVKPGQTAVMKGELVP